MKTTKDFDQVLKELGDLYEFNREIRKFSFVTASDGTAGSHRVSEETSKYEVRKKAP